MIWINYKNQGCEYLFLWFWLSVFICTCIFSKSSRKICSATATPCAFCYSWYFLTLLYLYITFRILCSGHTGHYPKWWCVQLQMMFVFFSASIIRWWKSWTKDRYGILQFAEHCILDVSALMRIIMLIGLISLLFQVLCFINLSFYTTSFPMFLESCYQLCGLGLYAMLFLIYIQYALYRILPIQDKRGAILSKLDSFALHCIRFNNWVSLLETMGKDLRLRKFVIFHKIMSLTI